MVEVRVRYEGELHCVALHAPSNSTTTTDAPRDNQGRGESFSPTDLVATALGTCMLTIMGIAARRESLDVDGTEATIVKHMVSDPLRRIGTLEVTIRTPREFTESERELLERAARTCPVAQSLSPRIEVPLSFEWGSASASAT